MAKKIVPIKLGQKEFLEKSKYTYLIDCGVKIESPLFVFVVEYGGKQILYDCGPAQSEHSANKNYRIAERVSLEEGLKNRGIALKDLDGIILSHLHWSHAHYTDSFGSIPIYIQRAELRYAINPLPCHQMAYNDHAGGGIPAWMSGYENFVAVDGDYQLDDGIELVALPGHTPGMQGLKVKTGNRTYLLAGDHYPRMENYTYMIPPGVHTDLSAWYKSHEKVRTMGVTVLPAHDECVFELLK